MEKFEKLIHSKKFKHTFFIVFIAVMLGWAGFRFATVASENAREVYNIARVSQTQGIPVETLAAKKQIGVLYEPLSVKNNRAYVSGALVEKLYTGQRVGNGTIKYVSRNVDLGTGMYLVRTTGVDDGLQFAEFAADGFFVPLHAISNNQVFIAENGVANVRDIVVAHQDAENAYVSSGLNDGDVVILTTINAGDKIKIVK